MPQFIAAAPQSFSTSPIPAATARTYTPAIHICRSWVRSIRIVPGRDLIRFREHLLRLTPACRRSRFGNEMNQSHLEAYAANVDYSNTRLLGFFQDEEMRGAAEIRSLQRDWCAEAETAFSVEKSWQSRGVGTALMTEAVRFALGLGIEHIYLSCHVRNRAMQRIAEKVAAQLRFEDDECFAHIGVRRELVAHDLDESAEGTQAGRKLSS